MTIQFLKPMTPNANFGEALVFHGARLRRDNVVELQSELQTLRKQTLAEMGRSAS